MSLINQALRKVQSERSAKNITIGSSDPSPPYAYHKNKSNKIGLMIGLGACIFVLISMVAGLLFLLLLKDPKTTVTEGHAQQHDPDAPAKSETTTMTPPPMAAQTNQLDTQEKPAEEMHTTIEPQTPIAEPKQEIAKWLSQSKVFGIRISKKGNKVILNNKTFTIGEIVNFDFDLKLIQIDENKLLFIDSDGAEYTKQL